MVPAPWLKHPKGIRDIAEWYMATKAQRDYVWKVFERQCELALKNLETLFAWVGDRVQVALITGTDFGRSGGRSSRRRRTGISTSRFIGR